MIQLKDLGNLLEPLLELSNLLEVITQLDNGCRPEESILVDDELAVLKGVNVALDKKQIGARFHWQEAGTGHVDTMSIAEMLNGGASSSLKLHGIASLSRTFI